MILSQTLCEALQIARVCYTSLRDGVIHRNAPRSAETARTTLSLWCFLLCFLRTFACSCGNLVEIMAERGVEVDHATLNRWVVKYAPQVTANAQAKKLNWLFPGAGGNRYPSPPQVDLPVPRDRSRRPNPWIYAAGKPRHGFRTPVFQTRE